MRLIIIIYLCRVDNIVVVKGFGGEDFETRNFSSLLDKSLSLSSSVSTLKGSNSQINGLNSTIYRAFHGWDQLHDQPVPNGDCGVWGRDGTRQQDLGSHPNSLRIPICVRRPWLLRPSLHLREF